LRKKRDYTVRIDQNTDRGLLVYINEHVTIKNQKLLKTAKALRDHGFKYVWSKNGKVFVRANNDSRIIHIGKVEEVDRLKRGTAN